MPERRRIDLSQPRTTWEILTATGALYRWLPLLFVTLAAAVMAPYLLAVLAFTGHGPFAGHEGPAMSVVTQFVNYAFVAPLISGLHIHAVIAVGEGVQPRLASVARRGLRVLPVVAAAELVSAVGTFFGFFALVIPGIVLIARWAVVAQAAAVEREDWLSALRSSAELTARNYRHVFALLLSVGVPLAGLWFGARAAAPGSTSQAASVAVGITVRTVFASVGALTTALLYFDLRARQDMAPRQARREYPHLRDLD